MALTKPVTRRLRAIAKAAEETSQTRLTELRARDEAVTK